MLVTGGFAVGLRVWCALSVGAISSIQMSPRSLDISTNSRSSTFLTTFGGNAAAGLNGPGDDSAAAAAAPAWPGLTVGLLTLCSWRRQLRPVGLVPIRWLGQTEVLVAAAAVRGRASPPASDCHLHWRRWLAALWSVVVHDHVRLWRCGRPKSFRRSSPHGILLGRLFRTSPRARHTVPG